MTYAATSYYRGIQEDVPVQYPYFTDSRFDSIVARHGLVAPRNVSVS